MIVNQEHTYRGASRRLFRYKNRLKHLTMLLWVQEKRDPSVSLKPVTYLCGSVINIEEKLTSIFIIPI